MSLALTVNQALSDFSGKVPVVRGTLAFSATYPAGGDTLNLTTIRGLLVSKNQAAQVRIWGKGNSAHFYGYTAGATLDVGKVPVTVIATAADLAAGAYPGGVTGDVVNIEIVLPKLV